MLSMLPVDFWLFPGAREGGRAGCFPLAGVGLRVRPFPICLKQPAAAAKRT